MKTLPTAFGKKSILLSDVLSGNDEFCIVVSGFELEPPLIFNIFRIEQRYLGRPAKARRLPQRLRKRLKRATSLPTMTQILKTSLSLREVISSEQNLTNNLNCFPFL